MYKLLNVSGLFYLDLIGKYKHSSNIKMADEEEIPSLQDLQKLRVVDLKKELQRLGLSQGT